ncbi:MAG: FHA domain-containing protein [Planctomycetes bacterium]|nr:FHA domain-containing protein [Planctomycetota bacterium]
MATYGELIPLGGGDLVPLLKRSLLVGRRESCDIVLRFANVSAHHCQLTLNGGYWYIKDLKSRNGIKVNGVRTTEKRIDPGDVVWIARHRYEICYSPIDLGAVGPPPAEDVPKDVLDQSLLQRAGLEAGEKAESTRYEVLDDNAGQLKKKRELRRRR